MVLSSVDTVTLLGHEQCSEHRLAQVLGNVFLPTVYIILHRVTLTDNSYLTFVLVTTHSCDLVMFFGGGIILLFRNIHDLITEFPELTSL